jgi:hypothetical protein
MGTAHDHASAVLDPPLEGRRLCRPQAPAVDRDASTLGQLQLEVIRKLSANHIQTF